MVEEEEVVVAAGGSCSCLAVVGEAAVAEEREGDQYKSGLRPLCISIN